MARDRYWEITSRAYCRMLFMNPPPAFIVPQKITKRELRRIFNLVEPDLLRRTNQRVDVAEGLASEEMNQVQGTTSHVYDWMEYDETANRMRLLATVHLFKEPGGTIGASSKRPDPIVLVVDGKRLIDP